MSDDRETTDVSDEQVRSALNHVHGRLRRRRNRMRGASLSAVVLVVAVGAGAISQQAAPKPEAPIDMMAPGSAAPTDTPTSSPSTCGAMVAPADEFDLEVTIQGPIDWPRSLALAAGHVMVEVRNVGTDSLTVWSPASTAVLDEDAAIGSGTVAPATMPSTTTLAPLELVEIWAALPTRTCTGAELEPGRYVIAPIVAVQDDGSIHWVRGTATSALHQ